MGHRELLLTVGAMVVFSLTTLSVNRLSSRNSEAIYDQQSEFLAVSYAQRFIEEAKLRAFDEAAIDGPVTDTKDFSSGLSLGHGAGETYPRFDDVDDFNGLTRTDTVGGEFAMTATVSVSYVDESALTTPVTDKKFYKRMTVVVTTPALQHSVQAEYVFAYKRI